ncbi:secreted glycosyl hydrolase [Aquipluma nitroreducens]|uniref:Secreted glycosyl hydrolase n=1 Tax=Aquipluma nitroreducens TaxID=2010828 RepID=A0A5K7S4C6_9BACT|nr:DUF1080 domain-containing protein [Aquipluma nitroreducens]BBE16325.1 secreted glycosyl hydrolase [Aquipluma nitroreducens]
MNKSTILILLATAFLFASFKIQSTKVDLVKAVGTDTLKSANAEIGLLNSLTEDEKAQGWILMFNGSTSEGWRGNNRPDFPSGWVIEDGCLKCQASGRGEPGAANGGDILYDKQMFSNFDLKLEWKISEGGNSGIFYLGKEVKGWPIYKTAPEMQVLDNDRHPDALLGKDGNRKAGSLYDLISANPQNAKPAGEWNSVEIICYQGTVIHKMNGEVVVEYHLWTPEWNELVRGSKFPRLNPDWTNVNKEGIIALQDHGNDVWFRNIKIHPLF